MYPRKQQVSYSVVQNADKINKMFSTIQDELKSEDANTRERAKNFIQTAMKSAREQVKNESESEIESESEPESETEFEDDSESELEPTPLKLEPIKQEKSLLNENKTKSIVFRLEDDLLTQDLKTELVKVLQVDSYAFQKKYKTDQIHNYDYKRNIRELLKELNEKYPKHNIRCVKNVIMKPYEFKVNSWNAIISVSGETVFVTPKFWFDINHDQCKKDKERDLM